MKTDEDLKQDVLDELEWEPSINATQIGVTAKNGIVTLSGHVDTYGEKLAAEKAAKRVSGVKAVVEEIDVKIPGRDTRTDEDIAQMALNNLKWNTTVPDDRVLLKVEGGWITMEGTVDWNYQKDAAKRAIEHLAGVRGVTNRIQVRSTAHPRDVKEKIRKAFERNATIDAGNVTVQVEGHKVVLSGSVQSWAEKRQAENAAWSAPGVTNVENNIRIEIREMAL